MGVEEDGADSVLVILFEASTQPESWHLHMFNRPQDFYFPITNVGSG